MWKLETITGDLWYYDDNEHEDAMIDLWIFGGNLSYIESEENEANIVS